MKRVVVTGIGLVTPLGCGNNINWKNLISGKSGARKITRFDATNFKCKVACEVPQGDGNNGTFNPEQGIYTETLSGDNRQINTSFKVVFVNIIIAYSYLLSILINVCSLGFRKPSLTNFPS